VSHVHDASCVPLKSLREEVVRTSVLKFPSRSKTSDIHVMANNARIMVPRLVESDYPMLLAIAVASLAVVRQVPEHKVWANLIDWSAACPGVETPVTIKAEHLSRMLRAKPNRTLLHQMIHTQGMKPGFFDFIG
jgi:hypothetical protein